MESNRSWEYRPLAGLARSLYVAFGVYGASVLASTWAQLRFLQTEWPHVDDVAWVVAAERAEAVEWFSILALVLCGVLFLCWLHRASVNARALGAEGMRHSPGWAVGGFFVPILNLWRPFQVVAEIWRASDPTARSGLDWLREKAPLPTFIPFWWVMWLFGGFLAMSYSLSETSSPETFVYATLAAEAVTLALVITLVHRLTRRQALRAAGGGVPTARVV